MHLQRGGRRPRGPPFGAGAPDAPCDGASVSKIVAASRSSGAANLSNRGLTEVPPQLWRLDDAAGGEGARWWEVEELSKLDLSHNALEELPAELWSLTALQSLHIGFNQLQRLPPGLGVLSSLRLLDASDNTRLAELPDEAGELPALAALSANNCALAALPGALGGPQQPSLSSLSAAGNSLAALPRGLASASALVVVDLSRNQLASLPGEVVAGWRSLRELNVSHNRLGALPDELCRLPGLLKLDVRSNRLRELPPALGGAGALVELHAGFNQIGQLPPALAPLSGLRILDVRNNLLQELPPALCALRLSLLDLTNNSLRSLPPELGLMTSLRSVPLEGNPLRIVRRELWAGPVSALLQHLRDRLPQAPAEGGDKGAVAAAMRPVGSTAVANWA